MPTIQDDVRIDAPIDEVFEYLASPERHVDVVASLVEGAEDGDLTNGGTEGAFTFEVLGMGLDGHFRNVEFDPPDRRVCRLEGDIEGASRNVKTIAEET